MKSQLNPMPEIKEDYSKIFNTMAVLSIVGAIFIMFAIPALAEEEVDAEPINTNLRVPIGSIISDSANIELPDVSYAFEVAANYDSAEAIIDEVTGIMETVDSVEAECYKKTYVGKFYITMYAATIEQCGSTSGITASGRLCTDDPTCWTVAVDPKIIPLGTYLKIDLEGYEDVVFRADDTGSAINNYDIDIFTTSEAESKAFPNYSGVDVWIVEEP